MKNITVLGLTKSDKAILIILPPIIGALIGWFIPTVSGWATKLPFIPFGQVLEWISLQEGILVSVIGLIGGIIVGFIFTQYAFSEALMISITDDEVTLEIHEKVTTLDKSQLSAVFLDKKDLVFLGLKGEEIFRGEHETKPALIAEGFLDHGFPWEEVDPYANDYARWVPEYPSLTTHENVLLSARERELKDNNKEEVISLRTDLAKLGIVIHDENKKQYIRIIKGEIRE